MKMPKENLTKEDFDDIVTDEDKHQWSQVCCGHAEQLQEEEGESYKGGLTAGGSGICGVKGCDVESEYYLDF